MKSEAAGDATSLPRLITEGVIIEASGLPIAVLEDERTARFTGGGGGGRADCQGALLYSEP